jgi:hypothetical protein
MSDFKVVDLGTKKGSAIDVFLKRGKMYYGREIPKILPAQCLGVDRAEKYRKDVEKQGFAFEACNVLEPMSPCWEEADYFLAWDFLEHLPSIEDSNNVLSWMLLWAQKGVWLKMPSFEQDEQGEGQLRRHGLRFAWTHWHGHPSHYKVSDARGVISQGVKVKHRHQRIIKNSSSKFIVPVDAPLDTIEYTPELGPKPKVKFDPPVIGCHELIVFLE